MPFITSWESINHWRARSSVEGIAALKLSDRVVCGWRTDLTFRITNLAHLENLTRSFKSVEWGDPCLRFWLWNARVPQIARLHLAELCFARLGWGSNIKIYASDSSLCWQPPLFWKSAGDELLISSVRPFGKLLKLSCLNSMWQKHNRFYELLQILKRALRIAFSLKHFLIRKPSFRRDGAPAFLTEEPNSGTFLQVDSTLHFLWVDSTQNFHFCRCQALYPRCKFRGPLLPLPWVEDLHQGS